MFCNELLLQNAVTHQPAAHYRQDQGLIGISKRDAARQ
jgi:hypothetical protein